REQERSISALTKQLRADGYPFHRLFVTGYLKALADAGILREKDIPPAKVYSTSAHREPNLYELVGVRCREATREEADQIRLAVSVLQKLFRRPIFLRELRECGFGGAVDAPQAPREVREEARRGRVKPCLTRSPRSGRGSPLSSCVPCRLQPRGTEPQRRHPDQRQTGSTAPDCHRPMRTIWVYKGTPNPPVKPSAFSTEASYLAFSVSM